MGIFKKEKMRYKEIVQKLEEQIPKTKLKDGFFEVKEHQKIASLEIGGYVSPRSVKKITNYFGKKGYSIQISMSGCGKYPEDPKIISFDNPAKIDRIKLYGFF